MVVPEKRIEVFALADKVGVKKEMIEAMQSIMKEYNNKPPKFFGAEELFYMIDQGMRRGGVDENPQIRTIMTLCTAYLYGYLIGRKIKE